MTFSLLTSNIPHNIWYGEVHKSIESISLEMFSHKMVDNLPNCLKSQTEHGVKWNTKRDTVKFYVFLPAKGNVWNLPYVDA